MSFIFIHSLMLLHSTLVWQLPIIVYKIDRQRGYCGNGNIHLTSYMMMMMVCVSAEMN